MATIAGQAIDTDGVSPAYSAAADLGDNFSNNGKRIVHIKNAAVAPVDVTFVTPATAGGLAIEDKVVAVPAGGDIFVGPFPVTYNDADGMVGMTYEAHEDLTLAVLEVG